MRTHHCFGNWTDPRLLGSHVVTLSKLKMFCSHEGKYFHKYREGSKDDEKDDSTSATGSGIVLPRCC